MLEEKISFVHKALRFLILGIPGGTTIQEPSVLSLINTILCCLFWIAQSWDDGSLTQASGLLQYLNNFLFCFIVFVFNKIFEQSSILFTVLQDRRIEFCYGASKIIKVSH